MSEMTAIEILKRKIELREQHLLLILLDLEAKRQRLAILKSKQIEAEAKALDGSGQQ